jgi:tetratricopeptide (TPR) repeat protein
MHAERDWLRHHVFPRLEEELRRRRYHLEIIDLRQGVETGEAATEEERELSVLKVCLEEIRRSRPFFIVLLGDRYGWIPPESRIEAAARDAGLAIEAKGKSVTALEIEFGILKDHQAQEHRCFFYFREPLPYERIAEGLRADYSDLFATDEHASARRIALKELKERLAADADIRRRIRTYSADWDREESCVTGLDAWGEMVFRDLAEELEAETLAFDAASEPTWEESERSSLAEFVEHCGRDFTGRTEIIEQLLALARSPVSEGAAWGACITGPSGSGKSALFAELYKRLEIDHGVLLLGNAAGATLRGSFVHSMLSRWIREIARFLDIEDSLSATASVEEVEATFASWLERASQKTRVVVLIDALNEFEPTPRAKHLTWRPRRWPPNARLVATSLPGVGSESLSQWAGVDEVDLQPLTAVDAQEIAQRIWKRHRVPWNPIVWRRVEQKRLPDGSAACGNPLWTTLACEQLVLLDAADFARAERQFARELDPQARLTQLRCDFVDRMPSAVAELYEFLLDDIERHHGASHTRAFACLVATSRDGWREKDLQILVPSIPPVLIADVAREVANGDYSVTAWKRFCEEVVERSAPGSDYSGFTSLQLANLRRAFRAHLVRREEMHLWTFSHAQMKAAATRRYLQESTLSSTLHVACVSYLIYQQVSRDPFVYPRLVHHLIQQGNVLDFAVDLVMSTSLPGDMVDAYAQEFASAIAQARDTNGGQALSWIEANLENNATLGACEFLVGPLYDALKHHVPLSTLKRVATCAMGALNRLPPSTDQKRALMSAHALLGQISLRKEDIEAAETAFEAEHRIATEDLPEASMFDAVVSDLHRSNLQLLSGKILEAVSTAETAVNNAQALNARTPTDAEAERLLMVCLSSLGMAIAASGNQRLAAMIHRQELEIAERLATALPSLRAQQDLAISHLAASRPLIAVGDVAEARQEVHVALEILVRLATGDPANIRCLTLLAGGYEHMGGCLGASGELEAAALFFQRAKSVYEDLMKLDPGNKAWENAASRAHLGVANWLSTGISPRTQEDLLTRALDVDFATADTASPPLSVVAISTPHPRANANEASRRNIEYQRRLSAWKALPLWKRLFTKRPEPVADI